MYKPVPSSSTEVLSLALLQWLRISDVSSSSLAPDSPFTPFLIPRERKKTDGEIVSRGNNEGGGRGYKDRGGKGETKGSVKFTWRNIYKNSKLTLGISVNT